MRRSSYYLHFQIRKLRSREVMRLPKVTQLEMAGAAPPRTLGSEPSCAPPWPGNRLPLPGHLHLSGCREAPGSTVTLPRARVPRLTLRPLHHPRSSAGSWHPGQATHTSHKLCGPGSDTLSTGHGVPSPAGSSLERAPAGTGHSTCSHTGKHHPKHL